MRLAGGMRGQVFNTNTPPGLPSLPDAKSVMAKCYLPTHKTTNQAAAHLAMRSHLRRLH